MHTYTTKTTKGFTLIELLVVIAIIGILATVVIGSVNSARGKGANAAIKSNIRNTRNIAELFYEANGNSYANVCGVAAVAGVSSINTAVFAAANAYTKGNTVTALNNGAGSGAANASTALCADNSTGFVVVTALKPATSGGSPTYWCADSLGVAKDLGTTAPTIVASSPVCP